jgi:hypothetical protein
MRSERAGLTLLTSIYEMRRIRNGFEKRRRPVRRQKEDALRVLLKCSETRKWRKQYFSRKWLLKERVAYKKNKSH